MQYYSNKKIKVKKGELENWKHFLEEAKVYIQNNQELKTNVQWCIEEMSDYL